MTTEHQATILDAYDYLTAFGTNDTDDAARAWQEGAEANANEAREQGWTFKGDWAEVWDEVLDRIAKDISEDGPVVIARRDKGIGICEQMVELGDATFEQCREYLKRIDSDEGWIDGAHLGHPGEAVYVY